MPIDRDGDVDMLANANDDDEHDDDDDGGDDDGGDDDDDMEVICLDFIHATLGAMYGLRVPDLRRALIARLTQDQIGFGAFVINKWGYRGAHWILEHELAMLGRSFSDVLSAAHEFAVARCVVWLSNDATWQERLNEMQAYDQFNDIAP